MKFEKCPAKSENGLGRFVCSLDQTVQNVTSQIKDMKSDIEDQSKEMKEMKSDIEEQSEKISENTGKISDLEHDFDGVEASVDGLKGHIKLITHPTTDSDLTASNGVAIIFI